MTRTNHLPHQAAPVSRTRNVAPSAAGIEPQNRCCSAIAGVCSQFLPSAVCSVVGTVCNIACG